MITAAGKGPRKKVSALCLLYNIYHRVNHPINDYLNHFVAACNALGVSFGDLLWELALVIPCCRTEQFSRSFLSAAVLLSNLLLSGVFNGYVLISFKSATNLRLLRA